MSNIKGIPELPGVNAVPLPASPEGPLSAGGAFARWRDRVGQMRDDGTLPPEKPLPSPDNTNHEAEHG